MCREITLVIEQYNTNEGGNIYIYIYMIYMEFYNTNVLGNSCSNNMCQSKNINKLLQHNGE